MLPPRMPLAIRCPRCGGRAAFDEPFEFFGGRAAKALDPGDPRPVHRWAAWTVREKYPSVISWRAPRGPGHSLVSGGCPGVRGGYRLMHRGVARCAECHLVRAHTLRWPADAFFQWAVRGTRLWAWNAEHARVLLHYVGSLRRDPARYPAYAASLRKLPAAILAARSRDLVARKIRDSLQRAGEPTDAPAAPDRAAASSNRK